MTNSYLWLNTIFPAVTSFVETVVFTPTDLNISLCVFAPWVKVATNLAANDF